MSQAINEKAIRLWMKKNIYRFIDRKTNEVNCTEMVEAWDRECSSGEDTLDSNHPAWDIAVQTESIFLALKKRAGSL